MKKFNKISFEDALEILYPNVSVFDVTELDILKEVKLYVKGYNDAVELFNNDLKIFKKYVV